MEATSELGMNLLRRFYNVARSNLGSRSEPSSRSLVSEADNIDPISCPPHDDACSSARPEDPLAAAYYANLELPPGASYEKVKAAYRRLLRNYHPDKHDLDPSKSKTAEEISKRLNEAMDYFEKEHKGGRL